MLRQMPKTKKDNPISARPQVGDTLELKSGGPKMTLSSKLGGRFQCEWFKGEELMRGDFHPAELKPAT